MKKIIITCIILFIVITVACFWSYSKRKKACDEFCGSLESFVYEEKCICRSDDGYFGTDITGGK